MSQEPGIGDVRSRFEAAIERELGELRRRDLRGPASMLSDRYRFGDTTGVWDGFASGEALAYLATRVPATFAATRRVLAELGSLRPGWAPTSLLDLGAGPGTATWAAAAVFPSIERAELVEREPEMAALGVRLARSGSAGLLCGPSETPRMCLLSRAIWLSPRTFSGSWDTTGSARRSSGGGEPPATNWSLSSQGPPQASSGCETQGACSSLGEPG